MARAMTITEKILARAAGLDEVRPGEVVEAKVDLALAHDVTSDLAITVLEESLGGKVWDPDKIVAAPDHALPNKDIASAQLVKRLLDFCRAQGIRRVHSVETGDYGVCHTILPQEGYVQPGMVVVGADSHTCTHGALGAFATGIGSTELGNVFATGQLWFRVPDSRLIEVAGRLPAGVMAKDLFLRVVGEIGVDGALYQAMEWAGEAITALEMEERLTLANMAIEAGAKSGIIAPDEVTRAYLGAKAGGDQSLASDPGARYAARMKLDASALEPLVAAPPSPANVKPAREFSGVKIHQAYLGSCTGGKLADFIAAAEVLKGRKKAPHVKLLVVPATVKVQRELVRRGLYDVFADAGAIVTAPGCHACLGFHGGILAAGEVAISATNRNFRGRMGHPESKVYLASPRTVAASALAGEIAAAQ